MDNVGGEDVWRSLVGYAGGKPRGRVIAAWLFQR